MHCVASGRGEPRAQGGVVPVADRPAGQDGSRKPHKTEKCVKSLIVIPTYNERENITELIADILRVLPTTDLLIVDDNSPDGTGQLVDEIARDDVRVRAVHRAGKLGLGTAYVLGFHYAIDHGYDLVFEMDADYSHDPKYLADILTAANQADLVIGSRYIDGGGTPNWSRLRKFVSGGGNMFARMVLHIPTHDCTGGYRCYRTAALRTIDLDQIRAQGYAFQVEMAYVFWKRGFRVREVPIVFMDRRVGKSKMSRKIFIEGFLWVVRTRLVGDPVVNGSPPMPPLPMYQPKDGANAAESDSPSAASQSH
jgi:dolichol-phosphate mannosyltransferase